MKKKIQNLILTLALLFIGHVSLSTTFAQGTAFTYQGQLNQGGQPANGEYDFTFALFNGAETNSSQIGGALTNLNVAVTNGLFTVALDFGEMFAGANYWLGTAVRANGAARFTELIPSQALTPAPYAIYAASANTAVSAGSVSAANIVGTIPAAQLQPSVLTNGANGVDIAGSFSGNGAGLTNLNGINLSAGGIGNTQLAPGTLASPVSIVGVNQTAVANTTYLVTNANFTTLLLPTNANLGDEVQITGAGPGGWTALGYSPPPGRRLPPPTRSGMACRLQPMAPIWLRHPTTAFTFQPTPARTGRYQTPLFPPGLPWLRRQTAPIWSRGLGLSALILRPTPARIG